jgi:hypothetical protein
MFRMVRSVGTGRVSPFARATNCWRTAEAVIRVKANGV